MADILLADEVCPDPVAQISPPATAVSLPRDQWAFKREGSHALAAMHLNGSGLFWTKFALADLPNEFIRSQDLERLLINEIDGAAVS